PAIDILSSQIVGVDSSRAMMKMRMMLWCCIGGIGTALGLSAAGPSMMFTNVLSDQLVVVLLTCVDRMELVFRFCLAYFRQRGIHQGLTREFRSHVQRFLTKRVVQGRVTCFDVAECVPEAN
ncbi:hypothetical protein BaRGS_00017546, partial [Batillaria attramentaria]